MNGRRKIRFFAWRFNFILIAILSIIFGLCIRVIVLTLINQAFLLRESNERILRLVTLPTMRGVILDRNGFPLAVSTPVYSVWVNPKSFNINDDDAVKLLCDQLAIKRETLITSFQNKNDKSFLYLKRGISPSIAKKIASLHLYGLYLQKEYRRFYPESDVLAHVIGFTNIDDRGQEGIELSYDDWLQGNAEKKWVIKDRLGRIIGPGMVFDADHKRDQKLVSQGKVGQDLVLSIDRRLQYLAYQELAKGVSQNSANSGSVVILDVETGEVLSMVNVPSFNPNDISERKGAHVKNRALTDLFEPGSTIKAFSMAAALESKKYRAKDVINTSPGWLRVERNLVKDERNYGILSLARILQKSSNVGMAKIILSLPKDALPNILHRVGIGEITGIGFPGEQSGVLKKYYPWGAFMRATLAFGYGVSTTALQLARAYGVLANHGIKVPITLLHVEQKPVGVQVIAPDVAEQTLELLETVINSGTGEKGKVPGFRVAGKTGTAHIVGKHGYEKNQYTSSFVGIAPLSHPRLVVAVVIHNPKGKKYLGGQVAGPIFEKIMEGSLGILNIAPDDM